MPSALPVAVVTGAGTGVGRATALLLGRHGWTVALLGRREHLLQETIRLAGDQKEKFRAYACDVSDDTALRIVAGRIHADLGPVGVLVNSAGTNTPARSWRELAVNDYRELIETNLTGAYLCVRVFLEGMRERKSGTIINIVSDAAKQASAKAGPAYVASKFALLGLTQSINAEEREHGIRACAILPGDIDTPLLDKRPSPPSPEARGKMLQPDDVAECVLLAIRLPHRAVIEELLIRPR